MFPEKKMTATTCTKSECFHHHENPNDSRRFNCAHPHKPNYPDSPDCPLFKLDWQKKLDAIRKS